MTLLKEIRDWYSNPAIQDDWVIQAGGHFFVAPLLSPGMQLGPGVPVARVRDLKSIAEGHIPPEQGLARIENIKALEYAQLSLKNFCEAIINGSKIGFREMGRGIILITAADGTVVYLPAQSIIQVQVLEPERLEKCLQLLQFYDPQNSAAVIFRFADIVGDKVHSLIYTCHMEF